MIIDSHTHLPSPGWPGHTNYFASEDLAVNYLKNAGIDAAIFNTWKGVFAETEQDVDEANAAALALYDRYPLFLYPGAVIHPSYPETSRKWLDEFRRRGLRWVGELVQYKCNIEFSEKAWLNLFEYCAGHGHIVQLHVSQGILKVADSFPKMQIICSHIDVDFLEKIVSRANISLDISGSTGGLAIGALEKAVTVMGADRVLFGTDFTGYEPRSFIVRTEAAVSNEQSRRKIFSGNVLGLLKKTGSVAIANQ